MRFSLRLRSSYESLQGTHSPLQGVLAYTKRGDVVEVGMTVVAVDAWQ